MKKYFLVILAVIGGAAFVKCQSGNQVDPVFVETEKIGHEIVENLGHNKYEINGLGWVGWNFRSRVDFLVDGLEDFSPSAHLPAFIEILDFTIIRLNKNKVMLTANEEEFNYSNTGFAITWPDPNSKSDFHTNALVQTSWDDEITVVYFLADGTKTRKYIPYETFKQLAEEKRFNEILHYGE